MTYKELDDILQFVMASVPMVNSVTNDTMDWNLKKDNQFPAIGFDLQNAVVSNGETSYNYIFTSAMLPVESEADRVQNYTALMQMLHRGLSLLDDVEDIDIIGDYDFHFGSLKMMDVLDVCTCQITIMTQFEYDCETSC